MSVDSKSIVTQTLRIQNHLKEQNQCLLNLTDLAAISVAIKCQTRNWKTLLANRKAQPENVLKSLDILVSNSSEVRDRPMEAAHILMSSPLAPTALESKPFLNFCEQMGEAPSAAMQTLYFLLPFAESRQSSFLGSGYFSKWFPVCASYDNYLKFKELLHLTKSEDYTESINSIFRKLDFSALDQLIPEPIAEQYGLRAPRPVPMGSLMELQAQMVDLVQEIQEQERHTQIEKIDRYNERAQALRSCTLPGTSMKAKHWQKKVNEAAEFLALMKVNPIDEQVLRSNLAERYNALIPKLTLRQQKVSYEKLRNSGNMAAVKYVPIVITDETPIDHMERSLAEMENVISVLEQHSFSKSN